MLVAACLSACRNARATPPMRGPVPVAADAPGSSASGARLVSDGPQAPAPAAGAAVGSATPLDELLATVEGEAITRRRIVRLIGERTPSEDEAEYEKKVMLALLDRTQTRILVRAAQQMGLQAPPDLLDRVVTEDSHKTVEEAKAAAEKAKPGSGASITFERILVERGQTMAEFRQERAEVLLIDNYFWVLTKGIQGKRPLLDAESSPAEIRRLYDAHRDLFDEPAGVRLAFWRAKATDFLLDGTRRTYDDALAAARAAVAACVADHARGGVSALDAGKAHGIADASESPPGMFRPRTGTSSKAGHASEIDAWLFDPARKVGDSNVFSFDDPVAVRVLEVRAGKSRSFEEAAPIVASVIQKVRSDRFKYAHLLELLSRANVSDQQVLALLVDRTRADLARLDQDPLTRDIRLR